MTSNPDPIDPLEQIAARLYGELGIAETSHVDDEPALLDAIEQALRAAQATGRAETEARIKALIVEHGKDTERLDLMAESFAEAQSRITALEAERDNAIKDIEILESRGHKATVERGSAEGRAAWQQLHDWAKAERDYWSERNADRYWQMNRVVAEIEKAFPEDFRTGGLKMTPRRLFTYLSLAEKQLLLQGLWLIGDESCVDMKILPDYWMLRRELEKAGIRHAELASGSALPSPPAPGREP